MKNINKFKIYFGGLLIAVTILGIGYGTTLDVNSDDAFVWSIFIFLIMISILAIFGLRMNVKIHFDDDDNS